MSNGVGESGKRKLDYEYAVARMAVAQICESVEVNVYQEREGVRFSAFQESALETLTDVAVQYVQSVGKSAQLYANVAGRVEGNSLDVVQALEDLGSGLGFGGVSDTERCVADSGVVKDIIRYVGEAEEMPFVYSLPRFPVKKEKRPAPSFFEVGVEPPDEHIPVWLPVFPDTKLSDRSEETNVGTNEGEVPCKENGSNLLNVQHSVDGGRLETLKPPNDVQKPTEGEGEKEVEGNPFLTAPVRFVEKKEGSPVFRPLELSNEVVNVNHVADKHMSNNNHHIPVLEASASWNEIKKKNSLAKSEDEEKKDGARTLVRFKMGTTKRPTCLAKNPSFQEQGWFQEGDDRGEKKSVTEERIDSRMVDSDVK